MKLFKKALAAVLAGVMALSMVACGTTPGTNPGTDIPDPNPTLTEADQFFQMLNGAVDITVNTAKWAGTTLTIPKFENKLQDKAAAILDAIEAGVVTESGKVTGYKLTTTVVTDKKLNEGISGAFYISETGAATKLPVIGNRSENVLTVVGSNDVMEIKKDGTSDIAKALKFDATAAKLYISTGLASGNWLTLKNQTVKADQTVISEEYEHNIEFGVASKVINGQTCTILVYKK